ncbi:IS1182 family transposase [Sporomusa termitida]|uniref:IS1182 family transposase n=1 Tax=Sporomusa termitida TaxID=2377 RepID=UPI0011862DCF|nr:IS1182 family transposase [Sporomusa termitida]
MEGLALLKNVPHQLSIYSVLYDKIPSNHILKIIAGNVDFSFINELLKDSYCQHLGRPAKEPEMLAKILILQYLYNLSDVKVIEEARLNLAYMWFLGLNPEEDLPDASLLAKFRKHRLKETSVDDMIQEVVRQCVEKGIIKGTGLSIDATHTQANTKKKVPERIMKHLGRRIIRAIEKENGVIPAELISEVPDYKLIEDHNEAKQKMKSYVEELIGKTESHVDLSILPNSQQAVNEAKEILEDPKFMVQKGVRSLVDKEARVGYKSKTDSFYGYKVEFAMLPETRIITAVTVESGAYVDGSQFEELYQRSKACGLPIQEVYGDKAYFRKPILDTLQTEAVEAIIPVNACVYKLDESRFSYNKDSDQWFCEMGNHTEKKVRQKYKNKNDVYRYHFVKSHCVQCPQRLTCAGKNTKKKVLRVSEHCAQYYEHSQLAKSDQFKLKYKKRASHEWKNGEMKRFHGLDRARGYGLKSMSLQAKLTALAVNLKRIAALISFCGHAVWKRMATFAVYRRLTPLFRQAG